MQHPQRLRSVLSLAIAFAASVSFAQADTPQAPAAATPLLEQGLTYHGDFDVPGDIQGHAFSIQGQPISAFSMPGQDYLIIGEMISKDGVSLAEDDLHRLVTAPMMEGLWDKLENATVITEGSDDAPYELYTFTDTNCPYCHKLWQDMQPLVEAGQLKVHHLLVGMLGQNSAAQAATLLQAENSAAELAQHHAAFNTGGIGQGDITAEVQEVLDANEAIMASVGAGGTPTSFYLDESGDVQMIGGYVDQAELKRLLGI